MPVNRLPVNKLFCFAGIFASDFVRRRLYTILSKCGFPVQTAFFKELLPKVYVSEFLYFMKQFNR
jgi:hypothetical protein